MNRKRIFILFFVLALTFFLLYSPHIKYPYPYHVDEWRAISEATKISNNNYVVGIHNTEIIFHLFLFLISKMSNLVLSYKFFPALWSVISAIALFFLVYKKTNNYYLGILSIIFFASIKSNVNIMGLWFFTPLTFSIPFIFLYLYFFTEGIEKQNKKFLIISLAIMILLVFTHALSFLFAIPILAVYSFFYRSYVKKEWKFFLLFLLAPLAGIIFYNFFTNVPFKMLFQSLFQSIQFKEGWGVLEMNNSPLEVYSLTGYILAFIGLITIIKEKKYILFVIWPTIIISSIIIFKISEISYLVPYQRNIYYLAISLPILSAFGTYGLTKYISKVSKSKRIVPFIFIVLIIILTFKSYYSIPNNLELYKIIDDKDYQTLIFLKSQPQGKVLAETFISTAVYPVSQKSPVSSILFDSPQDKEKVEQFFKIDDCKLKWKLIQDIQPRYIISKEKINCDFREIYSSGNYIYKFW